MYISQKENEDENIKIISYQIEQNLINKIVSYLAFINDKKILFETIWILINISYENEGETKIGNEKNNLKYILNFIVNSLNDKIMLYHILWLVRHLISKNLSNKLYFFQNNIFDLFQIISDKYEFDDEINNILIYVICNICRTTFFDGYDKEFKKVIPFLIKKINLVKEFKTINMILFLIYKFSDTKNINIIDELLRNNIHKKIIELYYNIKIIFHKDEEILQLKLYVLKIFGNITSGEDDNSYVLIKDGIIPFINYLLKENDDFIIKNSLWIIRNLMASLPGNLYIFFENNIINKIIEIGINIYEIISNNYKGNENLLNSFKHIIYIIYIILNDQINEYFYKIIDYKSSICLMFLVFSLRIFENNLDIIQFIFECIHTIILVDDINQKYFNLMLSFGLESALDNLMNCENDKIIEEVKYFHNKIINNNYN